MDEKMVGFFGYVLLGMVTNFLMVGDQITWTSPMIVIAWPVIWFAFLLAGIIGIAAVVAIVYMGFCAVVAVTMITEGIYDFIKQKIC